MNFIIYNFLVRTKIRPTIITDIILLSTNVHYT